MQIEQCKTHSKENKWKCSCCGIGLCKECNPVSFGGKVYCERCGKEADKAGESQKAQGRSFVAAIIGVIAIVFIIGGVFYYISGKSKPAKPILKISIKSKEKQEKGMTFEEINAKSKELVYDKEVVWDAFKHIAFGSEFANSGIILKEKITEKFPEKAGVIWQNLLDKGWLESMGEDKGIIMHKKNRRYKNLGKELRQEQEEISALLEDIHKSQRSGIKKWINPIIVFPVGKNLNIYKPMIEKHVENISKAIDHPIKVYDPKKDPANSNIVICFVPNFKQAINQTYRKDFEYIYEKYTGDKDYLRKRYKRMRQERSSSAFATALVNPGFDLWFATIFIHSSKNMKYITHAIEEELTQCLGIANDYYGFLYTCFNDNDITQEMTHLDWFLLKILYHEKIKPGMTVEEVGAVFDEVYADLIKKEGGTKR